MIIVGYPTYDGSENDKYNQIQCGENKEVHIVYNPVRAIPKSMHFHHCSELVLLLIYKIGQHNLNCSSRVFLLLKSWMEFKSFCDAHWYSVYIICYSQKETNSNNIIPEKARQQPIRKIVDQRQQKNQMSDGWLA